MIHELFCYLRPHDATAAIAFYEAAFGATEDFRLTEPDTGRIGHAQLNFGPTTLMLSEVPPLGESDPAPGAAPALFVIHLHVDDADAMVAAAVAAGGTLIRPLTDHFYGERSGSVLDPFGYTWLIGHSIEAVTTDEMQRRYDGSGEG